MDIKDVSVCICPNCGAENAHTEKCIYCGSLLSYKGIKSHMVSDKETKNNQYIYQRYNAWENKIIYAQKSEYKESDLCLRIYREVYADGNEIFLLYVKRKKPENKVFYLHLDSSVLFIKVGKTVYEVENAIRSKVDYDKGNEYGYFKIDRKILLDICKSREIFLRIKTYKDEYIHCNISSESNFALQSRIFYNIVCDNSMFSDAIEIFEKRKDENKKKREALKESIEQERHKFEERRRRMNEEFERKRQEEERKQGNGGCAGVLAAIVLLVGTIAVLLSQNLYS